MLLLPLRFPLRRRLIMTSGGVEGWLIDHTVGKSDSNVTSVDASGCGQYIGTGWGEGWAGWD